MPATTVTIIIVSWLNQIITRIFTVVTIASVIITFVAITSVISISVHCVFTATVIIATIAAAS